MTTSCAWAGTTDSQLTTSSTASACDPVHLLLPLSADLIGGQIQIAGQIHLDAVSFSNRDGRQSIQKPVHRLSGGLAGRITDVPGDGDGAALRVTAESGAEKL